MKNHVLLATISYYCLIIGAANLIMWTILIVSGKVEAYEENIVRYSFHWLSEFSTAILLIIAGVKLRKDKENLNLLFLSLGFLITSVGSAFIYYLGNFDVPMFIITTLISGATVIIMILIYQTLDQLLFFTNGIAIYGLLNIMGRALQEMDISLITMSVPVFLFIFIITINLLNKNVVFKYMLHTDEMKEVSTNSSDMKDPQDTEKENFTVSP